MYQNFMNRIALMIVITLSFFATSISAPVALNIINSCDSFGIVQSVALNEFDENNGSHCQHNFNSCVHSLCEVEFTGANLLATHSLDVQSQRFVISVPEFSIGIAPSPILGPPRHRA